MLENGVSLIDLHGPACDGRFPQISGFKFTFHYNPTGCTGLQSCRVVTPVDGTPDRRERRRPARRHTVAPPTSRTPAATGTRCSTTGRVSRELDAAVMLAYMEAVGPNFDPASYPLDRITKLGTPTC